MAKRYGNLKRRHGNLYYGGKYAARTAGAAAAKYWGVGTTKWGWKKGGKIFKRLAGGITGPAARLGSNRRRKYSRVNVTRRSGSNPARRTGSNPGNRTGSNGGRNNGSGFTQGGQLLRWGKARTHRYRF